MNEYTIPILFGVIAGTLARIYMFRTDYRQYPTYPHGMIIHLALGFIAASLGALVVPSIMEQEFTAVTFLTLAASQFREVRNMERKTLTEMDSLELVPRGASYIEGIAVTFEGRNYLVIFISFVTSFAYLAINVWAGLVAAFLAFLVAKKYMTGSKLGKIANIEQKEVRFEGAGLYVDNIYIMNIGIPARQKEILEHGLGFTISPKNFDARMTIGNLGQRQAILHDLAISLGVYRDSGTPALVPLIKRDLDDGRIGVFILPQNKSVDLAMKVISQVPTLENAIRMPTETKKKGSDSS
ncbi:YIEGIA domain-containing protein [Alkalihalobacillus hwajinpoensis]|uniref:YIEGIA family protein n=1 Tax=Guptibacillus hwajinpoensis TaxID=208199 RepID=UPI001883D9DB|nr:YIEGIA family protein [Pseudalkalibacillus hwajinpoensis]MBF0709022.1 YIEGIA domain-containing protein [Pseudalkalibacillus hwajinpoensis]